MVTVPVSAQEQWDVALKDTVRGHSGGGSVVGHDALGDVFFMTVYVLSSCSWISLFNQLFCTLEHPSKAIPLLPPCRGLLWGAYHHPLWDHHKPLFRALPSSHWLEPLVLENNILPWAAGSAVQQTGNKLLNGPKYNLMQSDLKAYSLRPTIFNPHSSKNNTYLQIIS